MIGSVLLLTISVTLADVDRWWLECARCGYLIAVTDTQQEAWRMVRAAEGSCSEHGTEQWAIIPQRPGWPTPVVRIQGDRVGELCSRLGVDAAAVLGTVGGKLPIGDVVAGLPFLDFDDHGRPPLPGGSPPAHGLPVLPPGYWGGVLWALSMLLQRAAETGEQDVVWLWSRPAVTDHSLS